MKFRAFLYGLSLLCSALTLMACSPQEKTTTASSSSAPNTVSAPAARHNLVFVGEQVSTINPLINAMDELPSLIFSGLMRYDGSGQPVTDVAESYNYDESAQTYTFKLRPQAQWHDDKPLTADDVVFTYQLLLSDAGRICPLQSNYLEIAKVEALDAHTVKFTLSKQNSAILGYFNLGLLPKHLLDGQNLATTSFNQAPVGSGRYRVDTWDHAAGRIELVAFDDFYGQKPHLTHLTYCTVGDENTKSLMLQSGEADLAWLNAHLADQFRQNAGFNNFDFVSADMRAIAFDFKTPFVKAHAAEIGLLNLAINKDALVQAVLAGRGVQAFSPLQLSPMGGNRQADIYPFDVNKFAQEMELRGWQKNAAGIYERDGKPFAFRVQVRSYEQERVDLAQICARMLQQAGVAMEVVLVPQFDWQTGYEAYLWGMAAPFDPDELYSSLVSGMSDNTMSYSNTRVDELLTSGRRVREITARTPFYQEFEVVFARQPSCLPLVFLEGNYVALKGLHGIDTQRVLGHHAAGVFWNIENWSWQDSQVSK
ncbi:MAG: hypothetical protein IAA31_03415 [Candidatus Anaerobiospirillum merdipullorum]|uniref:Solute-binding protein family 5 domain-containing protein n=1 Tax=Candidatus Anaerobiospirillum merdipullorum TaxID=2838450 RepID=A0A9E2NRU6_9GAMM|nr:hypothetical protein [Candidatus Anaerobiospirillum merdipullorum]